MISDEIADKLFADGFEALRRQAISIIDEFAADNYHFRKYAYDTALKNRINDLEVSE